MYITLTSSTTFLLNLKLCTINFTFCNDAFDDEVRRYGSSANWGVSLPVGDANRTLFLKQWPT
jgi:hypothetical protein